MCYRLWHATERRFSSKRTGWERTAHKKCMSNRRRCHIRYVSSCRDAGVWRPLRVKGTSEFRSKRREVRGKSTSLPPLNLPKPLLRCANNNRDLDINPLMHKIFNGLCMAWCVWACVWPACMGCHHTYFPSDLYLVWDTDLFHYKSIYNNGVLRAWHTTALVYNFRKDISSNIH